MCRIRFLATFGAAKLRQRRRAKLDQAQFVLRLAEAGDAAAVTAVVRAAYSKWTPVIGREPMPMRADYACSIKEHRIDVLLRDGRVAAVLETMDRPDYLWIESIAVTPELQGTGLGRLGQGGCGWPRWPRLRT